MECKMCDALLANYKSCVRLLTNTERRFRGAIGDDFLLVLKELKRLRQACKDADNALMEHWRQDHPDYAGETASS